MNNIFYALSSVYYIILFISYLNILVVVIGLAFLMIYCNLQVEVKKIHEIFFKLIYSLSIINVIC
jgi:hypothetical protein